MRLKAAPGGGGSTSEKWAGNRNRPVGAAVRSHHGCRLLRRKSFQVNGFHARAGQAPKDLQAEELEKWGRCAPQQVMSGGGPATGVGGGGGGQGDNDAPIEEVRDQERHFFWVLHPARAGGHGQERRLPRSDTFGPLHLQEAVPAEHEPDVLVHHVFVRFLVVRPPGGVFHVPYQPHDCHPRPAQNQVQVEPEGQEQAVGEIQSSKGLPQEGLQH